MAKETKDTLEYKEIIKMLLTELERHETFLKLRGNFYSQEFYDKKEEIESLVNINNKIVEETKE